MIDSGLIYGARDYKFLALNICRSHDPDDLAVKDFLRHSKVVVPVVMPAEPVLVTGEFPDFFQILRQRIRFVLALAGKKVEAVGRQWVRI